MDTEIERRIRRLKELTDEIFNYERLLLSTLTMQDLRAFAIKVDVNTQYLVDELNYIKEQEANDGTNQGTI